MTELPQWPPDWVEEHALAAEQTIAATDDLALATALRADDRVLISVSWPGGRRYLYVDPVGAEAPRALRAGDEPQDAELRRQLDAMWSQALGLAKQLIDGDLQVGPDGPQPGKKRRWRR
ncbi:hypothetical protein GKE82_02810 [Conexibacter sp. W3-3-2]|uniref:hypothetical protein n=1 Tax=Conexibacter sp. W3-3-2 TaxID=2675227 RepID=UPI0012B87311|nr:hypothetical protein [Conexibacter sp. W3-3-2]MTD43264.1 hypothetical protein [Conexibacter sp. W3-3-2]